MLLCCRKSCCSKAAGDKGALQGAGFTALQAPLVENNYPHSVLWQQLAGIMRGQSGCRDMSAVLEGSTSLNGKQSLPGDAKGRPSWCGFCAAGHQGPPPSAGDSLPGGKPKRLGEIIHTAMHERPRSSPVAEKMPGPLPERVVRCSTGTPARLGKPCHVQGVQLQVPWPRCPGCPGQARV